MNWSEGDFYSSCLKKWMRCHRGLQEPKLRSEKADKRPVNVNLKFESADLRLEKALLKLRIERLEDRFEA